MMTADAKSSSHSRRMVKMIKKPLEALPLASDGDSGGFRPDSGLFVRHNASLDSLTTAAILPRAFFQIDALDLAPRLFGKLLRRDEVVLQITEVEAYRLNDSACHGRFWDYCTDGSSGLETIQQRRGKKTNKHVLLTGPGKVGQALGLSTSWSNHPLYIPGGLELLDGPESENILVGPRVGIDYALPEHVNAPGGLLLLEVVGSVSLRVPSSLPRQ